MSIMTVCVLVSRLAVRAVGYGIVGFVIYAFLLATYRLTLHPLARYPGPFLAKITDWYSVYHAWKGDRHLDFWRRHEQYGPVFRYSPNSLSFNTSSALQTIYGHKSPVQKSVFYSVFPPTKDTFNTHSSINKAVHARKRRVLSHAFSDSALKGMEKYVLGNIRRFVELMCDDDDDDKRKGKGGWGKARNMADWSNYLTFDVMGDLCFGKGFGMLEREENRGVIELIGGAAGMHLILGCYPLLKTLHLAPYLFPATHAKRTTYMRYSRSQALARSRLGSKTDRKDFFHYLLNAVDPETGEGFKESELWGESNLLIIAGSDTTSTALAGTLWYLTRKANSAWLERVLEEVRGAFEGREEVRGERVGELKVLRACVDESMRLSPPVGGLLPREVVGGEGLVVDGLSVPKGMVVGVPIYAIHHNPDNFPDPFKFDPGRWMVGDDEGGEGEGRVKRAREAFCPFSVGPRGCIGKGLAYLELMVSLGRLFWEFDVRGVGEERERNGILGAEGREGEYWLRDCFTSLKDGPMVEFRRREEVV